MKIVFDTNVILSALITQGLSSRVLDLCIDRHDLFTSPFILEEITQKLRSKFHVPVRDIRNTMAFLTSIFSKVSPEGNMPTICRDPDDNNILMLASHVGAHLIITGDKDLLSLKKHENTRIITPREYMDKYHEKTATQ